MKSSLPLQARLRRLSRSETREALWGMAFVTPAVLGFLIFNIGPIVASLILSFTDYNILNKSPQWVGLDNYAKMLDERLFWKSLGNTLYYTLYRVPLSISIAFVLAVLVRRARASATAYRTAIYVPGLVPTVGSAVVWIIIFNPQFGLLNRMLGLAGIAGPGWLTSPAWAKPAIILMNLWQIGGTFVIFLAGLQDVPPELYDAAAVDGAGPWHSFWRITIPMMTPAILFNLVIEAIYAFQIFEAAFITTGGGPLRETYFMSLNIYDNGFRFLKMGYASALSWTLFVIIMAFTVFVLRSSGRWVFFYGDSGQ
jgi:multiple sugar transport system permease protein